MCGFILILILGVSSLFTEPRANKVGDLVTVVIIESSYAKNIAETRTDKKDAISLGAEQSGLVPEEIGDYIIGKSASGKLSFGNRHDGRGRHLREGKLKAYVTAKVVEVLENGNLRIEGKKKIHIGQDDQIFKVSGVVRPQDIGPGNQVLSVYLGDAHIEYKGKGAMESGQRRGILSRLFDWLF